MAKKVFAVIGLGHFGLSVVDELADNGMSVIAIDQNKDNMAKLPKGVTAIVTDSTNEFNLKKAGLGSVDAAVVAFGGNKESAVLTTVVLRELGVKQIIVRVDDPFYVPVMKRLGATEVITPQKTAGITIANKLGLDDVKDYYKINNKYSIMSFAISSAFIPAKLKDLGVKDYNVNILVVSRNGNSFTPSEADTILPNDLLHVLGNKKDIQAFREAIVSGKKSKKSK